MLQIFVFETASSQKDNLELLALRNELSEEADFLSLVILSRRLDLVQLVSTSWHGVTSFEVFCVDWIPIEEQVRDRAVIFGQVTDQSGQLRVRQSIVAESICKQRAISD